MHPFCFKDVRFKDTIYDLYKFAKSVRLIPENVDLNHCFYYVKIKPQETILDKENSKYPTNHMIDEK